MLWLGTPAWADGVKQVRVGATHFPPYSVRPEQGGGSGLLAQLVEALNRQQDTYRFVLVPTSIQRRVSDLQQGRTDLAMFENPDWGWQEIPHQTVDMGLEDAEVFIARSQPRRTQQYFDTLQDKRLALFNGYHYAFAGFNAEPRYLIEHYNATLTYSHDSNLYMVQRARADVALVTRSYLTEFLARNPDSARLLLVSERADQIYHHYAVLRPDGPISAEAFAQLLERLRSNGELLRIFAPLQITVKTPVTPVN